MPFIDPEEFLGRVMAPCLRSGWSPISPEALTLELSMKSWNGQEVIYITEILTPKESNWGAGANPGGLEWKDLRLILALNP